MSEKISIPLGKSFKNGYFGDSPKMSTFNVAFAIAYEFDFEEQKTSEGVSVRLITPDGKALGGTLAF